MQLENQLIQAFTGKTRLTQTTQQDWTAILTQYPAFHLGHYFRAKQQQSDRNHDQAVQALEQAALHFNDIRWLDYLLKTENPSGPPNGSTGNPGAEAASSVPAAPAPVPETLAGKAGAAQDIEHSGPQQQDMQPAEEHSRLSAVLSAQLADFKKPVKANAQLEVQRDPLYKVDYFASQGISLFKNLDGFDRKVRKFTDWLKEMKQQNTNSGVPQLNTTPQEEAQAARQAAASLKNEPVWTESMAEVLLTQGKTQQAREVYQKLSLLYPEKSTYFATKLDLLQ